MNSRLPYGLLFSLRILGDVMSMSLSTVVVRIDGKGQEYDRNQIKKMILVERVHH
jgi:hypothetical protein